MEYRQLNGSGLFVPALSLGTATFGGTHGFEGWGNTGVAEATRMVDMCLEAGLNLFDTADIYSRGLSEEILGLSLIHIWWCRCSNDCQYTGRCHFTAHMYAEYSDIRWIYNLYRLLGTPAYQQ